MPRAGPLRNCRDLSFLWFQHYEAQRRADIVHLWLMRINVVKSVTLCSAWWTKLFWKASLCLCRVEIMEATVSMTILDTVSPYLLLLPLFINSCPQTIVVLLTLPGYSQKTIDLTFDPAWCQNRVSALPQGRPQRHVTGSQWCNGATIPNSLSLPSFLCYTLSDNLLISTESAYITIFDNIYASNPWLLNWNGKFNILWGKGHII